jgi:hypothetical protein
MRRTPGQTWTLPRALAVAVPRPAYEAKDFAPGIVTGLSRCAPILPRYRCCETTASHLMYIEIYTVRT